MKRTLLTLLSLFLLLSLSAQAQGEKSATGRLGVSAFVMSSQQVVFNGAAQLSDSFTAHVARSFTLTVNAANWRHPMWDLYATQITPGELKLNGTELELNRAVLVARDLRPFTSSSFSVDEEGRSERYGRRGDRDDEGRPERYERRGDGDDEGRPERYGRRGDGDGATLLLAVRMHEGPSGREPEHGHEMYFPEDRDGHGFHEPPQSHPGNIFHKLVTDIHEHIAPHSKQPPAMHVQEVPASHSKQPPAMHVQEAPAPHSQQGPAGHSQQAPVAHSQQPNAPHASAAFDVRVVETHEPPKPERNSFASPDHRPGR